MAILQLAFSFPTSSSMDVNVDFLSLLRDISERIETSRRDKKQRQRERNVNKNAARIASGATAFPSEMMIITTAIPNSGSDDSRDRRRRTRETSKPRDVVVLRPYS